MPLLSLKPQAVSLAAPPREVQSDEQTRSNATLAGSGFKDALPDSRRNRDPTRSRRGEGGRRDQSVDNPGRNPGSCWRVRVREVDRRPSDPPAAQADSRFGPLRWDRADGVRV